MTALFALLAARSLTAPMPSAASAHRTTDADASFSHLLGAAAQDGAADAEEAPTIQRHAPLSERDAEAGSQQTTDDVPASSERALFVSLRPGGGESPPSASEKAPSADRIDVPAGEPPTDLSPADTSRISNIAGEAPRQDAGSDADGAQVPAQHPEGDERLQVPDSAEKRAEAPPSAELLHPAHRDETPESPEETHTTSRTPALPDTAASSDGPPTRDPYVDTQGLALPDTPAGDAQGGEGEQSGADTEAQATDEGAIDASEVMAATPHESSETPDVTAETLPSTVPAQEHDAVPQPSPRGADASASSPPQSGAAPGQSTAVQATAVQTTVVHSAAGPSASGAAPTTAQPLNAQLGVPVSQAVTQIVAAGGGERVLTITVAPEGLGPVTVRAHLTPEGMRIELFSPQEQGRDALRGIVADLRRDLAGLGVSTGTSQVSVSDQEAPASQPSTHLGQHSRAADQQLLDAQQQSRQQFGEHARDGASAEADTPQAGPAAAADAEQGEPPLPDSRTHYIPGSLDLLA